MGILDKLFSKENNSDAVNDQTQITLPWNPISKEEDLDQILDASNDKPQCIFKHSTRCSISRTVLRGFEEQHQTIKDAVDFHYLDLLTYRPISAAIAEKFEVEHQSPQLIVVNNGKVLAYASHSEILEVSIPS